LQNLFHPFDCLLNLQGSVAALTSFFPLDTIRSRLQRE
jgi:hypothetical protein